MIDLVDLLRRLTQVAGGTPAAGILLRVSVFMVAALVVSLALRRNSAALQHMVWTLALAGALLIPLFAWALPGWQWAVLPQRPQASLSPAAAGVELEMPAAQLPLARSADAQPGEPFDLLATPPANATERSPGISKATGDTAAHARVAEEYRWNWASILATLWAVGSLAGFAWLSVSMTSAWYVVRSARPADDLVWQRLLRQLLDACGVRRTVEVRKCDEVFVPMTWGFRRPVILVPADSAAWSEETKRSVLLHELGHIRRGDCLLHLLGRLTLAIYWLHPLVWLAARQLGKTSERASDDVVLSSNVAPPDYAQHLVGIAGQLRGLQLFGQAALPMASRSDLQGRVLAILDSQRSHHGLNRKTCFGLMIAATLFLLPCALLRPSTVQAADERQHAAEASDAKAQDPPEVVKPQSKAEEERASTSALKIKVQAVDAGTGNPLADVPIDVRTFHIETRKRSKTVQKTDAEGKATIEIRDDLGQIGDLSVAARPGEYVPQYYDWSPYQEATSIPDQISMSFQKGITVGGQIQDSSGQAVANATIEVLMPANRGNMHFHVATLKSDEQGRWRCDVAPEDLSGVSLSVQHPDFTPAGAEATPALREQKHVLRLNRGVLIRGRVSDVTGHPVEGVSVSLGRIWAGANDPQAKTDAGGQFVLKNCPLGASAVTVQGEGFAPQCQELTVLQENPPLSFRLEPGATLRVRVVDQQGMPLEGVLIYPDTWRDLRTLTFRSETDKQGRFVWKDAPGDTVIFHLSAKGFMSDRNRPLTASNDEHTIALYPELLIRGTVVDEETGEPIEKFRYCSGFRRETEQQAFFSNRFTSGQDGRFEYHMPDEIMPNIYVKVVADGYQPAISPAFNRTEGEQSHEFKLKKGKGLGGVVLLPDGKPAQNATVALASTNSHPFIKNGNLSPDSSAVRVQTDATGRFSFVPQTELCSFVALHVGGYAEFTQDELDKSGAMTLQPWGRLEGVVKIGSHVAGNVAVTFQPAMFAHERSWSHHYETSTDNEGHFAFDRVYPGKGIAARVVVVENGSTATHAPSHPVQVEVHPAKTTWVEIGGKGRPVVGHIDTDGRITNWTDAGHIRSRHLVPDEFSDYYSFKVESDGSFRIDEVAPGEYILDLRLTEPIPYNRPGTTAPLGPGAPVGAVKFDFSMPATPEGQSDKPLDLGTIKAAFLKP